jgi:1-acyl-sn-glycerol-3-phosphate acyltransferase
VTESTKAGNRSASSDRFYRTFRAATMPLFRRRFKTELRGLEHLPATGGFILAPGGHRSIIDTPLTALCGDRVLRFMGAENYFAMPGLGWFLRAMGGFPVERGASDRAALKLAEQILADGEPLVMFPEGTRGDGPVIDDLKEGVAFLACRAEVPIVPVGLGGAARSMPPGVKWPRPTKTAVVVGEPIRPPQRIDGERVKRSTVRTVNAELHAALQQLFDEAQLLAGVTPSDHDG